jgi:hypothetical protein
LHNGKSGEHIDEQEIRALSVSEPDEYDAHKAITNKGYESRKNLGHFAPAKRKRHNAYQRHDETDYRIGIRFIPDIYYREKQKTG